MRETPSSLASQCLGTIVRSMPQHPKNFEIASVDVRSEEGGQLVRTGLGTAAPHQFVADVRLAVPDIRLKVGIVMARGGLPVVHAITVWATPAKPLTSGTLRQILIDPIVRAAVAAASRPVTDRSDVAPGAFHAEGDPEGQLWVSTPAGATERVQQVARLYNEALTAGSRSPGLDAANAVHISRGQVARYIKRAREMGLIPPLGKTLQPLAVTESGEDQASWDPGQSIFIDSSHGMPGYPEGQPIVAAIVTSHRGVLIGRRNDGKPPWTFIAGEQDAVKDENPADTAVREVKEETGLQIVAGERIGERVHPKTGRTMIYISAVPTHGTDIFVNDEEELAEVRWAGLAEADELLPGMFEPVREHLARELGRADSERRI